MQKKIFTNSPQTPQNHMGNSSECRYRSFSSMSGFEDWNFAQQHLPLPSPEILPRSPNRHFNLGYADFPGFRCIVPGFAERRSVLAPSANQFSCALPVAKDSIPESNNIGLFDVKLSEKTIKEELKEANDQSIHQPVLGKLHKKRKPTAPIKKASEAQDPESTEGVLSNGLGASSSCRYDSSLSLLTKKFLNLLLEASDGTLDLNKAAKELDVQKRRMYDITNVLEGIGLIEKSLKNMIRLKATHMSRPKEVEDYKARLRAEIETLRLEEHRVDKMIRERQDQLGAMMEDDTNKKWLHVTREDINTLPCFEDSTLIAIEAPHGTIVEVPDPNESLELPQRVHMVLRSSMGPIHCYLLSKHEERFGSSNSSHHPGAMDLCKDHGCSQMDEMMTTNRVVPNTSRQDQNLATDQHPSEASSLLESSGTMVKIEPSDLDIESDYWFLSELGNSLAEIWAA